MPSAATEETTETPAPQALPRQGRVVPLIIASAMFMEQLDGTVLSTALPSMAHSFGIDALHMSVALTSYLVSLAVFIPASGALADRLGSRTVFCAAIVLFTVGSILCAQSGSLPFLVVARLIQGMGGAMMVPVGRLVLLRTTAKSDLIATMNWLLVPATIGPLLGPPVGGFLVTALSWQWIFYINVPIGVVGLVLAAALVPQLRASGRERFDVAGMVFSGVSLAGLIFGLELASRGVVPAGVTASILGASVIGGLLYWRHARRTARPILDFTLMRIPTFGLSVVAGAATRIAVGATPFLLPLTLQVGLGMSAAQSGATTFVTSIGGLAMRGFSRRLLRRFGYRRTMIGNGLGASLFAFACAAFSPGVGRPVMWAVLFLGGFFQSLQFTAYNTIAYADVPAGRMSAATSFYATMQQVTLTLGICIAAAAMAIAAAAHGGGHARLADLAIGWVTVGTAALLAPVLCARLSADAGEELSGHHS
jgi:EmrB/QacA subfamily drug resistance transporter